MLNVKTKKKRISGWSRSKYINANIFYAYDKSDIEKLLKYCIKKNIKVSIRATGSSFGDQSYISKGITCDISEMNKIIDYDKSKNLLIEWNLPISHFHHKLFFLIQMVILIRWFYLISTKMVAETLIFMMC